ncbi:hypothetical protein [Sporomusa sphaeroides]|uniref:hypothetical protein n=1 Tax=Sporomusa sphaeroides TaxID=47679 RepID=UPI00202F6991|nr:hypothetical protein [Sporomusa sphaeroides]MCM0759965.1 hypothetical protein [Sporomusa sphaeroides DSM 2875]HML33836.1 hypothetical protein [Sporomusa sphaeroides]
MRSLLRLTLRGKQEIEFKTESQIAEAIAKHHGKGGVFCSVDGQESLSIDFKDVIAVQVMPLKSFIPSDNAITTGNPGFMPATPLTYEPTKVLPTAPDKEKEKALYKVECKCGADYFCRLFSDAQKCRCRECNDTVFVDNFAPKRTGDNSQPATLVTNKYRVSQIGESA